MDRPCNYLHQVLYNRLHLMWDTLSAFCAIWAQCKHRANLIVEDRQLIHGPCENSQSRDWCLEIFFFLVFTKISLRNVAIRWMRIASQVVSAHCSIDPFSASSTRGSSGDAGTLYPLYIDLEMSGMRILKTRQFQVLYHWEYSRDQFLEYRHCKWPIL